jgi:hypothetical protein
MVENLGLVGKESFAAIGANGKWQRRRSESRQSRHYASGGYRAPLTLGARLRLLVSERCSAGEIVRARR